MIPASREQLADAQKVFFMLACGPVVGLVFDNVGPLPPLIVGTFLHVFGLMMTSISKKSVKYHPHASQLIWPTVTTKFFFPKQFVLPSEPAVSSILHFRQFPPGSSQREDKHWALLQQVLRWEVSSFRSW